MLKRFALLTASALLAFSFWFSGSFQKEQVSFSDKLLARIEVCGDGRIGAGEECDRGSGNGACPSDCGDSCRFNSCGGDCELPTNPYFSSDPADLERYARRLEEGACYWGSNPVDGRCVNNAPTEENQGGWRSRNREIECDAKDQIYGRCYAVCNHDNNCYGCYMGDQIDHTQSACQRRYSCAIDNGPYLPPNDPGTASVSQPDYCFSGPAATAEWTYSDPGGSPQSAYQVQIDDQGSFNSPEWDSGKVSCSGCRSNATPQGYLEFNTTYRARARVWNQYDLASGWTNSSTWTTPRHAFPQTDFTFAPADPDERNIVLGSPIQFTDRSTCYNNSGNPIICDSWLWNFDDSSSSTQRDPQHTYGQANTYYVDLEAADSDGNSCFITKPVEVIKPNPIWIEVNPGG